jgi:hypothetical protein
MVTFSKQELTIIAYGLQYHIFELNDAIKTLAELGPMIGSERMQCAHEEALAETNRLLAKVDKLKKKAE